MCACALCGIFIEYLNRNSSRKVCERVKMMETASVAPGRRVIQTPPEFSFCAGCNTCEIVCSLTHDGVVSPSYNRIFVEKDARKMFHTVHSCQHCAEHPCFEACPKKGGAMLVDGGIVYIDEEKCTGCGLCRKACTFEPPRINIVKSKDKSLRKAKKCDLCRTQPDGPACVRWCPVRCIEIAEGGGAV